MDSKAYFTHTFLTSNNWRSKFENCSASCHYPISYTLFRYLFQQFLAFFQKNLLKKLSSTSPWWIKS